MKKDRALTLLCGLWVMAALVLFFTGPESFPGLSLWAHEGLRNTLCLAGGLCGLLVFLSRKKELSTQRARATVIGSWLTALATTVPPVGLRALALPLLTFFWLGCLLLLALELIGPSTSPQDKT